MLTTDHDLVIVGSGPAGYTAGLYAARANLQPVLIEGWAWGGLLQQTTDVENFPGFPDGILGPQLMQQMRDGAAKFGAQLISEDADTIELGRDGARHVVRVGDRELRARALILATGAHHQVLGLTDEAELTGRGVSYCATCDASFFRDVPVGVVGGGDSAVEEALFLARFTDQVTLIHRRNEFRASEIMLDRARANPNITLRTCSVVTQLQQEEGKLTGVTVRDTNTEAETHLPLQGLFVAVGQVPNSGLVAGQTRLDPDGYLLTQPGTTLTDVPGFFAAGDLVDRRYRQAVTAAASGCAAALDAGAFLSDLGV